MPFFVYILQSESSGRFYTGQTDNLPKRIVYHNSGYVRATRNRGPWKLVYAEEFATRAEAVLRERQLKRQKDRRVLTELIAGSTKLKGVAGERSGGTG